MANEQDPIAKRIDAHLVEYVCPKCGWYDLSGVFREFLPFIDHLIQDFCLKHHPLLSCPIIQPNGTVWFQKPGTNELILGLPKYSPAAPEWKVLLKSGEKILAELEDPEFRIILGGAEELTPVVNLERGRLKEFAVEKSWVCLLEPRLLAAAAFKRTLEVAVHKSALWAQDAGRVRPIRHRVRT